MVPRGIRAFRLLCPPPGRGTLTGATAQTQSLVVITDGIETAPKWISQVASQITENTYAVGIGKAADIIAIAL